MKERIVTFNKRGKKKTNLLTKEVIALKLIRLEKRIPRKDAAKAAGVAKGTMERFENGRTNFSKEKTRLLMRKYRVTESYVQQVANGEVIFDEIHPRSIYNKPEANRKSGRKYQKQISKESRVLKVFRKMCGLTQVRAAALCNWHPSSIDHIENGRTQITKEKIKHIMISYGKSYLDFEDMMDQDILRDEVLEECHQILETIDQDKLKAVQALLINFK